MTSVLLLHFIDKENKARRVQILCPRSQSSQRVGAALDPRWTHPRAHRLNTRVTAFLRQEASSECLTYSMSSVKESAGLLFTLYFPTSPLFSRVKLKLAEQRGRQYIIFHRTLSS